jgi:threonine aldolase
MLIDLRSDTVTKPTEAMRRAMAEAEVGDDVWGEDPSVNRLEARAAEIVSKEAAMYVPSGIMGNNIGLKLHTEHGQEIICDSRAHILEYELAMMAWFCGCVARPIPTEDGILSWAQIRREIRPVNPHSSPTGLIEIENTHNTGSGAVYPLETIRGDLRRRPRNGTESSYGWRARIQCRRSRGRPVREVVAPVDTVMFA